MLSAPALLTSLASRTALAVVILSIVLSSIMGALRSKKWKAQGKHVFITGGSQGLGLAVAELLASKGANITICSRTESKLREALGKVKVSYVKVCLEGEQDVPGSVGFDADVIGSFVVYHPACPFFRVGLSRPAFSARRQQPNPRTRRSSMSLRMYRLSKVQNEPSSRAASFRIPCFAALVAPNRASLSNRPKAISKRV